MTAEEHNVKERQRASIVAKLRGYTPFDEGDTGVALKAKYMLLTGEPYRTAEEEALSSSEARREERDVKYQEAFDAAMKLISDAKAKGFMDCRAIRDALGFDKPKPNGSPYSSMEVAYRWIEDAGEKVVYILPDGGMYYIGGVPKDDLQNPTHWCVWRCLRAGEGIQSEVVCRPSGQGGRDQCRSPGHG